jgi:tetratricopeptide (TPR) repeat protein
MVAETRPVRRSREAKQQTIPIEPMQVPPEPQPEGPTRWQRLRPRLLRFVLGFFGLLLILALVMAGAVYGGIRQGEIDKTQERQRTAEERYQAGLTRLDAGEFELAIAEFEYVLELAPDSSFARLAQQGIAEARARSASRPTPTSETRQIVAEDLYRQAVEHYEAKEWEEAAAAFTQLRALDPTYQAEAVEEMLFTSLYSVGMALLDEDRFEEGIFYLDQAVALRPLDEEALTQRSLAVQYMTALGYWGADWGRCIERFEQLYAIAPNYQDVFQRLYQAHVNYADAWYAQGEMCPAEEQYTLALQLTSEGDPAIEQKRAAAEQICLIATPTPIAPIEGTQVITLTQLPPGFSAGRLAYPVYNTQSGLYDVYALFIDGRMVRMATGADQPSWLGASGALGYRNLLAGGISLLVAGEAAPRQVASEAGLSWPTFSPDGSRMAYAAQDAGGDWQIYIAPLDGSTGPVLHASGKNPAWGPAGLLAWTGCDAGGACGIFVDNLDDGQPATRLTGSIDDIGLNWTPDGGSLVYMSNVTGNWDLFRLGVNGGVTQLTSDPSNEGLPAWAPDGSGLAFVSDREGLWAIYLMGPNGENPHKALVLGPSLPDWTSQRLAWAP